MVAGRPAPGATCGPCRSGTTRAIRGSWSTIIGAEEDTMKSSLLLSTAIVALLAACPRADAAPAGSVATFALEPLRLNSLAVFGERPITLRTVGFQPRSPHPHYSSGPSTITSQTSDSRRVFRSRSMRQPAVSCSVCAAARRWTSTFSSDSRWTGNSRSDQGRSRGQQLDRSRRHGDRDAPDPGLVREHELSRCWRISSCPPRNRARWCRTWGSPAATRS